MVVTLELEQEAGGRWLAEVPELPGRLVHATPADEAKACTGARPLRLGLPAAKSDGQWSPGGPPDARRSHRSHEPPAAGSMRPLEFPEHRAGRHHPPRIPLAPLRLYDAVIAMASSRSSEPK